MTTRTERQIERMNRAVVSGRIVPFLALSIIAVTLVSGLAVWVLSPRGFDGLSDSLWWAAQTVTTVGYGDVVPASNAGRVIGFVVMAFGVSAVSFLTAAVTSAFLASHQERLAERRVPHQRDIEAALERIERRLEALDQRLGSQR